MTRKRKGKTNNSPGNQSPSSPVSSPENQSAKKKVAMSKEKESSPELMAMLVSMNTDLNTKLSDISKTLRELRNVQSEVTSIKREVETVWKRVLAKTVVIYGIQDHPEEAMEETEQKVRRVAHNLGLEHLDVDIARRMGKFKTAKQRPIELTLVRQKQKIQLMKSKISLKENEETQRIYIAEARTPDENTKFLKLLSHAKKLQAKDNTTRYHFIGGQVLEIQSKRVNGKFHVDLEGNVTAWEPKEDPTKAAGDGVSTASQSKVKDGRS